MKDKTFRGGGGFASKMKEMFGMDIRSLALFRVGLAIATIGDLIERSLDLRDHYGDEGIFPRAVLFESYLNQYTILIHGMNGTTLFLACLWLFHIVCALFLLIGYKTRTFTFICWMLLVSLQSRNPFLNHGGDLYFRIIFFYAMFLPLGGCWSVDSALKDANTKQKSNRNPRVLTGGTAALIAQISMMYLVSTAHKTGSEWRSDYTATWYALQLDYYKTTIALILQIFPKLLEFLTWAVFQWEFFGNFCFFFPVFTDHFRLVGAIGFFLMHVGFIACLRLGFFFWVCTVAMFPMLPPTVWEFFLNKYRNNPNKKQPMDIQLQFDDSSKFSKNLAFIMATFMAIPTTQLTPFQVSALEEEGKPATRQMIWLYAENSSGKVSTNLHAIKSAYEHSPTSQFLRPFLLLPQFLLRKLPKTVYEFLACKCASIMGHYHAKSRVINYDKIRHHQQSPYQQQKKSKAPIKLGHIFIMGVVLYCLSWNLGNLGSPHHLSPDYNWIGLALHVDQFWGMFSPHPPKVHWFYVFAGELDDGKEVELFKNRGLFTWEANSPVSFDKPEPFAESFKNHRWYKFFEMGFNGENHENIRLNFGRWVCREYNARHSGVERLYRYKVYFLLEYQNLYGNRNPPTKQILWDHICYHKNTQ